MLNRLFPKQFDNTYRGHWLGLWLFVPAMLLTAAQGAFVIANTRNTAITADAIPLGSYGPAAADTVVSLVALLGLFTLILPVQSAVVLIRYRAMVPFMYLCLLILEAANRILLRVNPIARADAHAIAQSHPDGFYIPHSGFYVGLLIMAMTIAGFALSLLRKSNSQPRTLARGAH